MRAASRGRAWPATLGIATALAVDVGHRGDGRTDEPALPARRAVDELLQLGPAVGLRGDALAVRVGQRIDGDPVSGLARGAAHQLPGALGLGGEGPFEEAEGEPARFELALVEEAIGDEQEGRGGRALRGVAEPALDGGEQRPADAVDRSDPGRDALLTGQVLRVGEVGEACGQGRREAVGVVAELRQGGTEGLGRVAVRGDEGDGVGRGLARAVGSADSGAGDASGAVIIGPGVHRSGWIGGWTPLRASAFRRAVGVALAQIALACRVGGDVDPGRRGQLDPGRGSDDVALGIDDPPSCAG